MQFPLTAKTGCCIAHHVLLAILLIGACLLDSSKSASSDKSGLIIIIDSGSTGSRLFIFKTKRDPSKLLGYQVKELDNKKISPGLSKFGKTPRLAAVNIIDLITSCLPKLRAAQAKVSPPNRPAPLHLMATAGLRQINKQFPGSADKVISEIRKALKTELSKKANLKSAIKLSSPSNIRMIPGKEEALFSFLSLNQMQGRFDGPPQSYSNLLGMLEMGGGSAQIAYPIFDTTKLNEIEKRAYTISIQPAGNRPTLNLYARSFPNMGFMSAQIYFYHANKLLFRKTSTSTGMPYIHSSCLSANKTFTFKYGLVKFRLTGKKSWNALSRKRKTLYCIGAAFRLLRLLDLKRRSEKSAIQTNLKNALKAVYSGTNFVAVGNFAYNFVYTRKVKENGKLTLANVKRMTQKSCAHTASTGKYAPFYCLQRAYIYALLKKLKIATRDDRVRVSTKVTFPPGAALYELFKESRSVAK